MKYCLAFLFFSLFWINPGSQFNYSTSQEVFSEKGKLLRLTLSSDDKYRVWTPLSKIPYKLINTFLVKEDRYFYSHYGVNPWAIVRSFFSTYILGGHKVGGSTITMQLARLHYNLKTRTPAGKIVQMMAATWLELLYTKDEILEAYLNLTPFGRNIEGVGAAARIYFQRGLGELATSENVFLAIVPQRPHLLNKHRKFAAIPDGFLESYSRLIKKHEKENSLELYIYGIQDLPFLAPHLTDYLLRSQQTQVIHSTLSLRIHKMINETLKKYVEKNKKKRIENAVAVLLDYDSMEIKSLVGSANFHDQNISGQVNGAFALRSPGSTLKPFIYALAMNQGLITPQTFVMDAPLAFRTPENFDNRYLGPMSAEKALITSRNVPAVYLASLLKGPNFFEFLSEVFPNRLKGQNIYGSSLALGGVEFSMLDLVQLYSSLANQGNLSSIRWTKDSELAKKRNLLAPEGVAMVMDILAKHPRPGTHYQQNVAIRNHDVYWKTGTSFGFRDAWSIGIIGNYVLGVWLGNFSGEGNPELIGSRMAGPLFFEIADRLKSFTSKDYFPLHRHASGLEEVEVCALTGKLPNTHCPHRKSGLFIPGVSAIAKCQIHRQVLIDQNTGLRSCRNSEAKSYSKIVEIWPSHIMKIFARLGIPRKKLPSYIKECGRSDYSKTGAHPQILIPHKGLKYTYRHRQKNTIAFLAKADSDVTKIHWYLNDKYIGAKKPEVSLMWNASPGYYKVRAVDDHGRQAERQLTVITLKE